MKNQSLSKSGVFAVG